MKQHLNQGERESVRVCVRERERVWQAAPTNWIWGIKGNVSKKKKKWNGIVEMSGGMPCMCIKLPAVMRVIHLKRNPIHTFSKCLTLNIDFLPFVGPVLSLTVNLWSRLNGFLRGQMSSLHFSSQTLNILPRKTGETEITTPTTKTDSINGFAIIPFTDEIFVKNEHRSDIRCVYVRMLAFIGLSFESWIHYNLVFLLMPTILLTRDHFTFS